MKTMMKKLRAFWDDEQGATAIEYGLIAALVAVAVIAGASALGVNISGLFNSIAGCMANPVSGCMSGGGLGAT